MDISGSNAVTVNSIRVANSSAPCPALRTRAVWSGLTDSYLSASDHTAALTATCNSTTTEEVVGHSQNDWLPLVPKLEPDSDDAHRNNGERPPTIERMTVGVQQQDETEWNVHLSSVSVVIDEEYYPEIKSENLESAESGGSHEADRSEADNDSFPYPSSQNNEDGFERIKVEFGSDDEAENLQSPDDESSVMLDQEIGSAELKPANVELAADNRNNVHNIQSTNEQEILDDSPPNELIGALEATKPVLELNNLGIALKKSKGVVAEVASTSHGSSGKKYKNTAQKAKTKKIIASNSNASDDRTDASSYDSKRFECSVCRKGYHWRNHLTDHFRTHTGEKPYKCHVCEKGFGTRGHLTTHEQIHSGEKPYKCHVCEKRFARRSQLTIHTQMHLGRSPYTCQVCRKPYNSKSNLRNHSRIHTGEKPYACQVCSKAFTLAGDLKRHSRIHTGEKPYKCDVCPKSFSDSGGLTYHTRKHNGEKPYKCLSCEKSFSTSGDLKRHALRMHSDEKPYQCPLCQKAYSYEVDLTNHARIHHQALKVTSAPEGS